MINTYKIDATTKDANTSRIVYSMTQFVNFLNSNPTSEIRCSIRFAGTGTFKTVAADEFTRLLWNI